MAPHSLNQANENSPYARLTREQFHKKHQILHQQSYRQTIIFTPLNKNQNQFNLISQINLRIEKFLLHIHDISIFSLNTMKSLDSEQRINFSLIFCMKILWKDQRPDQGMRESM